MTILNAQFVMGVVIQNLILRFCSEVKGSIPTINNDLHIFYFSSLSHVLIFCTFFIYLTFSLNNFFYVYEFVVTS